MSETTIPSYFLDNMTNMAGILKQTRTGCPSWPPGFNPDLWWVRIIYRFSCLCCFVFYWSSSCVLCIQCCQWLWIVHSWLPIQFSLTSIWFCVPKPVRNIKKKGHGCFQVRTFFLLLHVKIYIIRSIDIHVYHFCITQYILISWIFNN